MEVATKEKEATIVTKKKGWGKFLNGFTHFLMYGGWILVVVLVMGIWITISILTSGK